jgi:hypothetical protein
MNIQQTLEHNPKTIFWFTCIVLSVLQYFFGLQHFYFDAERYWESGRELVVDGQFSLFNHVTQRGVLFPLVNYGLIELLGFLNWHEISVFKVLNTVFVCWGLWFVVPSLYAKATGNVFTVVQRLALICLFHFFWFRYVSCPLSDFLCLFLLLQGFNLLWSDKPSFISIIVVGLICGFVFNTRPIYNLLLVLYPVFLWMTAHQSAWRKLLQVGLLVAMACIISIPQVQVNQKVWGVQSIFQATDKFYEGGSLYLGQLRWGLYVQKYDTYVGDTTCYPTAQVFYYHNKATMKEERAEANQIQSYPQYLAFVSTHPIKIIRFAKNVFNGLDLKYNTAYLYQIKSWMPFSILNYLVWFIAIVILFKVATFKNLSSQIWWIVGYLGITCLLCVPIAIEPRFLSAVYLVAYTLIIAHIKPFWAWWRALSGGKQIVFILLLLAFESGCLWLSQQTYKELEFMFNC